MSAAAVCGCLGQQDFVGFVPSLAGAPAHVEPKARCGGKFAGRVKYYYGGVRTALKASVAVVHRLTS